jgi:hypothetical protein
LVDVKKECVVIIPMELPVGKWPGSTIGRFFINIIRSPAGMISPTLVQAANFNACVRIKGVGAL